MIWLFDFYGVLCHPIDGKIHETYNTELITFLKNESQHIQKYIFTSGTITDDVREEFANEIFTGIFTSAQLGSPKSLPYTYEQIAATLKVPTKKLVFFDDQLKNITAAQKAGVVSHLFETTPFLVEQLKYLL